MRAHHNCLLAWAIILFTVVQATAGIGYPTAITGWMRAAAMTLSRQESATTPSTVAQGMTRYGVEAATITSLSNPATTLLPQMGATRPSSAGREMTPSIPEIRGLAGLRQKHRLIIISTAARAIRSFMALAAATRWSAARETPQFTVAMAMKTLSGEAAAYLLSVAMAMTR